MEKVFIFLGPTGTGKTSDSIKFGEKNNGEILNIDSAQFYKNFNIGTGIPSLEERKSLIHHFFSFIEVEEELNSFEFIKLLENKIEEIIKNKKTPIIVGGSHFYIYSLFFKQEEKSSKKTIDFNLKKEEYEKNNSFELWQKLNKIDKNRAEHININDKKRIINSLISIEENEGIFFKLKFNPKFNFVVFEKEKGENYKDILKKRIDLFFESGWIKEVENLKENKINFLERKKFIGYLDIIKFIKNNNFKNENKRDFFLLKEEILKKTFFYAKKQSKFIKKLNKELTLMNVEWTKI